MIEKVRLMGAGAVGAYFISGLTDKDGIDFALIADGKRKQSLERDGVKINGRVYRPRVIRASEADDTDLLLVSLKYSSLLSSLSDISKSVGKNTIVMSLMNGVDSEEIIAKEVGDEHLVYSMMKIVSHREPDGEIVYNPQTTPGVFFGEKDGAKDTARIKDICSLLDGTGIRYTVSNDIMCDIWGKFLINVSRNLPQAVISVGCGAYDDSEHVAAISEKLREEVIAVAKSGGIDISASTEGVTTRALAGKDARYSTLQDLDAGRRTEIDMFAGVMMRLGREAGIPVPYCEAMYHFIKALEEKNEGKFDYS